MEYENKNVKIDKELWDKWEKYCNEKCIHSKKLMSKLLMKAMENHLKSKSFLRIRFRNK